MSGRRRGRCWPTRRAPARPSPPPAAGASVGVSLPIPLVTGYRNTYQIAAAQTQAELAAVERDRVGNQVALEVWRAYYRLQSETEADGRRSKYVESARAGG